MIAPNQSFISTYIKKNQKKITMSDFSFFTYFFSNSSIAPQCSAAQQQACFSQFGGESALTFDCNGLCGLCDLCNTQQAAGVPECASRCASGKAKCNQLCENGKSICLACGVY